MSKQLAETMMQKTEDMKIQEMRDKVETQKPKVVAEVHKVSKEEALQQAKIVALKFMTTAKPPENEEELKSSIGDIMHMIYAYFHKVNVHVTPQELMDYMMKGADKNGDQ